MQSIYNHIEENKLQVQLFCQEISEDHNICQNSDFTENQPQIPLVLRFSHEIETDIEKQQIYQCQCQWVWSDGQCSVVQNSAFHQPKQQFSTIYQMNDINLHSNVLQEIKCARQRQQSQFLEWQNIQNFEQLKQRRQFTRLEGQIIKNKVRKLKKKIGKAKNKRLRNKAK